VLKEKDVEYYKYKSKYVLERGWNSCLDHGAKEILDKTTYWYSFVKPSLFVVNGKVCIIFHYRL